MPGHRALSSELTSSYLKYRMNGSSLFGLIAVSKVVEVLSQTSNVFAEFGVVTVHELEVNVLSVLSVSQSYYLFLERMYLPLLQHTHG